MVISWLKTASGKPDCAASLPTPAVLSSGQSSMTDDERRLFRQHNGFWRFGE